MTRTHEQLLRRLSGHDERCLREIMAPSSLAPASAHASVSTHAAASALSSRLGALVCLAALFACDAPTASVHWAVERAASAGVDDEEIIAALASVGSDIGSARIVSAAGRLATSIGCDITQEIDELEVEATVLPLHAQ